MKAVTEFPSFTLTKAVQSKSNLVTEGKTPEEIQASIGESFKLEGDKLKYFMNAIDVANTHKENLKRVLVVSLNEGEATPAKAVKVDELYYIPEPLVTARPPTDPKKGGRGGHRKGGDRPKSSPWGLSPEEKAAKNKPKA
jgi:hypothetical protein